MAEFTNTYEIRSTDETWFNATLQEISEILSHVQKHNFLRRMFNFPWVIPSYVLYSAAVFGIMHFALGFVYGERPADHLMENVTFIPASHLYLFRILTFTAITLTICYLYPDVEFALETKRYIRRKKIRKAIVGLIGVICTIVVYPYLTNLIM